MKPTKSKTEDVTIEVIEVKKGTIPFYILGTTPLICARLSEKAKYELLYPAKKTRGPKETLKHNPLQEYRDSPYKDPNPKGATLLMVLAAQFKAAIRNAALDIPGVKKSEIGRLCWVEGERIPLYGIPCLGMDPVRSSDMNRTPDIRTRAYVKRWATMINISFVKPQLNESAITRLLAAAGMTQGIGDWRTEKGAGTFGSFQIVDKNNPEFAEIVRTGGRKMQESAMETPDFKDLETEELFRWFESTVETRGDNERLTPKKKAA